MCIVSFIDIYLVVSNANRWDLRRWSIDKLRDELVNLLNQEMGEDSQIDGEPREDYSKMDIDE